MTNSEYERYIYIDSLIDKVLKLEDENEMLKKENRRLEDSLSKLNEYVNDFEDQQENERFEEDFAID